MRRLAFACVALALTGAFVTPASAQTATGNRANGLNYQPTPGEVLPRERQAGVTPPAAQQRSNDRDLEAIDRNLLSSHGLSTSSVPKISNAPQ